MIYGHVMILWLEGTGENWPVSLREIIISTDYVSVCGLEPSLDIAMCGLIPAYAI